MAFYAPALESAIVRKQQLLRAPHHSTTLHGLLIKQLQLLHPTSAQETIDQSAPPRTWAR
jgi:hypothetical protein